MENEDLRRSRQIFVNWIYDSLEDLPVDLHPGEELANMGIQRYDAELYEPLCTFMNLLLVNE